MARVKSFDAPHKGLRKVIAKFSLQLGHTSFSVPSELAALQQLGQELFTLLRHHAHTENEYTLKSLEERVKGASEHDQQDHERLEAIQQALEQELLAFTGNESSDEIHRFYLAFSMFQSQYLEHIFEEETLTESLLQQHFTDKELIEHRGIIMQKMEFPMLLLWMKYIVPSQREEENITMLSGFKANAPEQAFTQVLAAVENEMDPDRFQQLMAKL